MPAQANAAEQELTMSAQYDVLDFTHVALLFNLATGPRQARHFCPDGDEQILAIIVTAANELRTMGLVSIAGESLETFQFSLTQLGKQTVEELGSGRKPDAYAEPAGQKSSPELPANPAKPEAERREPANAVMTNQFRFKVLVVDDDAAVCDVLVLLLQRAGYEVSKAVDGFDALLQLKVNVPDVLISDLEMPQMSGFELLSVVRRRFPQISVIAMSGAYQSGDAIPGGVIADSFYNKGQSGPEDLLQLVAELVQNSAAHAKEHQREPAPVWIPRNGHDSQGVPYVVVTCTECLRSFPLNVAHEHLRKIQETFCLFCHGAVRYVVDFSLGVVSPRPATEKSLRTKSAGASR